MKFSDVLRFFYGLSMGTSTQYLRPKQRPLFPLRWQKVDDRFYLAMGGSHNCGVLLDENKKAILIDTGMSASAKKIKEYLAQIDPEIRVEKIICTHYHRHAVEGCQEFLPQAKVLLGAYESEDKRTDVRSYLNGYEAIRSDFELAWGQEKLKISLVKNAHTKGDLVVELENRGYLFTGGVFYHRLHPELSVLDGAEVASWIQHLEKWAKYVDQKKLVVVPGEGEITKDAQSLMEFAAYLRDLQNPEVEFARCRELYDWQEIIGISSLAQNFDYLRHKTLTHTTLDVDRD